MAVGSSVTGITSPSKVIANIFISFIGAGLLGLPYAFKESGILEGAVIMSVVGYLSVAAMLMIIDCKYAILSSGGRAGGRSITMESKTPLIAPESSEEEEEYNKQRGFKRNFNSEDITYGDIGLYAFGAPGKRLVDITIVISQIGFCCGYLIYLCENLKKHVTWLTQGQWLILILPPIYGLTLLRHLNKLAMFSLFAQFSNVFALTVVFWFDFSHSEEVPFHPKEVSLKGLPFFFAVSIYCYEGAGMILSLEESVAKHKKTMFRPIFVSTMIALTFLYISFGASGYLSFGPHTQQIITLNLPHGKTSVDFAAIVKICLGVSFFFTYPLMLFPVTHLLDKSFGLQNDKMKGNMVRLVLVLLTGIVVSAIPSFAVLASLIGATCCTLLAFIMPAAFHMAIFKNRLTRKQRYFNVLLIILGVFGTVVGLWDTVGRITEQAHIVDELAQVHSTTALPQVSKFYDVTVGSIPHNVTVSSVSLNVSVASVNTRVDKINDLLQMSLSSKNKSVIPVVPQMNNPNQYKTNFPSSLNKPSNSSRTTPKKKVVPNRSFNSTYKNSSNPLPISSSKVTKRKRSTLRKE